MNASEIFSRAGADIVSAGENDAIIYRGLEIKGIYSSYIDFVGGVDFGVSARRRTFVCNLVDFSETGISGGDCEEVVLKSDGVFFIVEGVSENTITKQAILTLKRKA